MEPKEYKYLSPAELPDAFNKQMMRALFIGNSGSGKTYTLVQMLKKMKGYLDCVYVVNPTMDASLRTLVNDFNYKEYDKAEDDVLDVIINEIKENIDKFKLLQKYKEIFKKYIRIISGIQNIEEIDFDSFIRTRLKPKEVKILEDYDYESPDVAFQDFPYKYRPPLSMIILDDSVGTKILRVSKTTPLNSFFIKARHYFCNFCILTQYFKAIPKLIRANCNYFFIWRTYDSVILKSLYEEINSFIEYDHFLELFKQATVDKYGFLLIDTKNRQIRSGLDNIIYSF